MFESEMVAVDFSKQLCIAKYNSSASPDSVFYQDLVLGDGQGVATGDVLEITFTGWLFQNGSLGQVFDSNVNKEQLLRLKLGSGKVIKDWEDAMIGMKRGGRQFLLIPPALAYWPLGEAEGIPPDSTLAFEVEVKWEKVRVSKELAETMVRISQIQQRLICLQKQGMDFHSQLNEALTELEGHSALVNLLHAQLAELEKLSDLKSRYQEVNLIGMQLEEKVAGLDVELAYHHVQIENLDKVRIKAKLQITQLQLEQLRHQKQEMDLHSQVTQALTESEGHSALVNRLHAQLVELQKSSDDIKSRYQEEQLIGKQLDEKPSALGTLLAEDEDEEEVSLKDRPPPTPLFDDDDDDNDDDDDLYLLG
ncbi:FK506-binding protein 15-like isoform X3 [Podarcis lilfordi]|uniref:peptidylprolyl isomerase n=1 Tax=Podarcis lilfordi TaxID=74358 RepID=A0AA35K7Q2_9SAUR|nr:FK506-binding protein 15-like isoform X3 [Podarcis lilfordi]